jgi:uncharacterized protein (DUF1684 family)
MLRLDQLQLLKGHEDAEHRVWHEERVRKATKGSAAKAID